MIRIVFLSADGARRTEADAAVGARLLDVAQAAGQPLEGACEGAMACSTCHVILPPDAFALLPPPTDAEEDMLDFAIGACRTSRLSCQVILTAATNGIEVRIPAAASDARRN